MRPTLKSILLVLFLAASFTAFGQASLLRRANSNYNRGEYFEALRYYKQILAEDYKLDVENRIRMAQCYYGVNNIDEAFNIFLELENELNGYDLFVYASTAHKFGFYEGAIDLYRKARSQNPTRQGQIDELIRSCQWAMDNQTFAPNVRVNPSTILTFGQSFGLQYYDKGVVYSSASPDDGGKQRDRQGKNFLSLYYSDIEDGMIKGTRLFSENLVFPGHAGAISFTAYRTMYYTRVVRVRGGQDVLKIFSVEYDGSDWVTEKELSFNSDDFDNAHPAVSPDYKNLYFVSNRPGGYGGKDLWVVERLSNRRYGTPRNLGPDVNTYGNEEYPFVSKDNVLYFSSDGHTGFGGLDIFRADNVNGTWTNVKNMMQPFNSTKDDFGYVVDPNNNRHGFLSSNRTSDGSEDAIFYVQFGPEEEPKVEPELIPVIEPVIEPIIEPIIEPVVTPIIVPVVEETPPVVGLPDVVETIPVTPPVTEEPKIDLSMFPATFTGVVNSTFNGDVINGATVVVSDARTGTVIVRSNSDANGRFSLTLPDAYRAEGQEFNVSISMSDYNTKNLRAGILEISEVGKAGITLTPIFKEADLNEISGLVIPYIGNEITANGYRILDQVAAYLLLNKHVVIKLNGHTDARGNMLTNLNSSQTTAETAESYLISKGVSSDNIIPRGYGERYILNNCRRGKLCNESEHLENRRVEVVVWRFLQ